VRLENSHVIKSNQIWVGAVSTGPTGNQLNSGYKSRNTPEYKTELGLAIGTYIRLLFSYIQSIIAE
jgi:regulator of telomere elongation helicase 1